MLSLVLVSQTLWFLIPLTLLWVAQFFFEVLLYFPNVESIPGKPEAYISFCLGERYCDLVKSNINYIKSILHFPEYMLLMTSTTVFVSSLVSRVLSLSRISSRRFLQIQIQIR